MGFIDRHIQRRIPAGPPPLAVNSRRVYILPTPLGWLFAGLTLLMFFAATNYANNIAHAFTFWLAAVAVISMYRANRAITGLRVEHIDTPAVHAGEPLGVRVVLMTRRRWACRGVVVRADRAADRTAGPTHPRQGIDIRPGRRAIAELTVMPETRGWHPLPGLHIETVYPLGFFRCWTRLAPTGAALIYPRLAGQISASGHPAGQVSDGAQLDRLTPGEEFVAHRRYQPGDPTRSIDWKASARAGHPMVAERRASMSALRWYDYDALTHLEPEARLSQLALWVTAARSDEPWALVLAGRRYGPDTGTGHRHRCLKALALY